MSKIFIIFVLFTSLLYAELDPEIQEKKVYIKGEALTAHQVLKLVESQLNIKVDFTVPDEFNYKKAYNHHVSFGQVLQAVINYYREYNHLNLEIISRSKRRIVLREVVEKKPDPVAPLTLASKRVNQEIEPEKAQALISLDAPSEVKSKKQKEEVKNDSARLEYELRDLVVLEDPNHSKEDYVFVEEKSDSRKSKAKSPVKTMEVPLSKLSMEKILAPTSVEEAEAKRAPKPDSKPRSRVLKVEALGDLVDFDDEVLKPQNKSVVAGDRNISERLGSDKPVSEMESWKEKFKSSEWLDSPKVEQGYFGAYSPWSKPTLLNYRIDRAYQPQFSVSLGVSSHEDIGLAFEGIDLRTQKLTLAYGLSLSEALLVYLRSGLVNHDGQLAAKGFVYRLNEAGFTDTTLGFNYIPKGLVDVGAVSLGFELSLPTGEDNDFAGSGALNATGLAGYHLAFGRWRAQTQLNLSILNDYEVFLLDSESYVFSYDLGLAYYHNEYLDFAWNLHWSQSPWDDGRGIWGEDGWMIQTLVRSHAWTDQLSFYVDVGLYGAVSDFGGGLQWLTEFQ